MEIKSEIRDIIAKYPLKEPVSVDSVFVNIDNDLYFITDATGKKYTVREAKRVKEKDSDFEANLLRILGNAGFDSTRVVSAKDGSLFTRTPEGWPVFLFTFIEGKQYETGDIKAHPELAYLGGKALGKMHAIAATHKKEIGKNKERNAFTEIDAFFKRDLSALSPLLGFMKFSNELREFKEKALEWMLLNPDLCGAIHSDFGPQNTIFDRETCHIIDFDWACYGPYLKDVGQGVALWVEPTPETEWDNEVSKNFVKGYNEAAPRVASIGHTLAFWACFACLSDACTFFLSYLDGRYPDVNLNRVEQCHGYKRYLYFKKYL